MPGLSLAQQTAYRRRRKYGRRSGPMLGGQEKTVTFGPAGTLGVRVWIALAPDLSASWLTWNWFNITAYVRWEQGVSTSQGRRDQDDTVAPSTARLTLSNPDGLFARLNAMSPLYGQLTRFTPIRFENDPGSGFTHRYFGFINDWPKRWQDKSAEDPTVSIVCRGPMHRLIRQQNHVSPLFASLSNLAGGSFTPRVYVPMEDGANATQFASALTGGNVMTFTGDVTPAGDDTLPGSKPLPYFGSDGRAQVSVAGYTDTNYWHVAVLMYMPDSLAAAGQMTMLTVVTDSPTIRTITLHINPGAGEFGTLRYDPGGVLVSSASIGYDSSAGTPIGAWTWATLTCRKDYSGSDDHHQANLVNIDAGASGSFGSYGDLIGATGYGRITAIGVNGALTPVPAGAAGTAFGHTWAITDPQFDITGDTRDYSDPATGWVGELAHVRVGRVCAEAGISLWCQASTSAALGVQPQGNVLAILRDAEAADLGLLYEYEFGLGYQALSERYNQPVGMALDIAEGHVTEDLEPADNDMRYHNRWTAHRKDGSFYIAEPVGGLSSEDLIYGGEDTFGVETDSQLPDIAGWLVHRDTTEEDYWPSLGIDLRKSPDLIPSWTSLLYGGRVTVANVMEEAGVTGLDLVVEGWEEFWNSLIWTATLNTSPASIYNVGVYGTDTAASRYDSDDSALDTAVSDSATTLSVATTTGHALWVSTAGNPDEFPFDINVGGEQMTVTAVGATTSPQPFTVIRSVNSVVKDHGVGAKVSLWTPARYAL